MHALAWNYIALFAAITAVVLFGMRALSERARRDRDSFARSVPATARVLKVGRSTISRSYGGLVVELLIQVQRSGVVPYEMSTMWTLAPSAMPKVKAGQSFAIKIDPVQPSKIYSAEEWVRSLGVMSKPIDKYGG